VAGEYRPFNITFTKERIDWKKVVGYWLKKQDPKNKQDHVFIARLGGSPTTILDCSIASSDVTLSSVVIFNVVCTVGPIAVALEGFNFKSCWNW
jgi:hypothetical protein